MLKKRCLCAEQLEARFVPTTYTLSQGANLQSAIDQAHPGDVILLAPGATFSGPFTLDAKSNSTHQWITIETNNFSLSDGIRVSPSNASSMAQILAPSYYPAIQTQPGSNYYILRGLNILPVNSSAVVDTLVTIGDGSSNQASTTNLPNNIQIDQCFIHGWDGQQIKRGVALNDGGPGSKTGVYNSYVSDFKLSGQDSQAIAGWNGTGPYTIQNNYLEAAGENVIFGGAYSYIQQVPSNITIVNNTCNKLSSWNPSSSTFAGTTYAVKNLLELKNAQNITIDHNTFENNWVNAQDGHAIVFTPRGAQDGGSFANVSNVTFTHNLVENTPQGFDILGSDDSSQSQVATNLRIQNNIFQNIGGGASQYVFTVLAGQNGGTKNLVIDHNTIMVPSNGYLAGDLVASILNVVNGAHYGFQFTNNLMPQGQYGLFVSGYGQGPAALAVAFPDGVITGNVIVGGNPSLYPPGNYFPSTWAQAVQQYPTAGAQGTIGDPGNTANNGGGGGALTVQTPAQAATNPVTGTSVGLSVLGQENGSDSGLTYTWSSTGPANVTFSANGTNAAKNTTATFSHAGTYTFTATISDGSTSATSSVQVTVNQTLTSLQVRPATATVANGATVQFSATALDQFGLALTTQPAFAWSIDADGLGTVSSTGLYTAPATGVGSATVRASSGTISAWASVSVVASSTATFIKTDTTDQGNWQHVYGAQGYNVIGASASYPAYATVTPSGQSSYVWAQSTNDVRALSNPAGGRIAATWYAANSFSVNINLTDGQTHQVALYLLDWDSSRRSERIDVVNSAGQVTDSRTISSFNGGEYLVWNVSGNVTFRITHLAGSNAVLSGLFFDPPAQ
jgi:hypothetical protein